MEELPNSRVNVKLFRRFPDEGDKEVDYGPGYLMLYPKSSQSKKQDEEADNDERHNNKKGVKVVFRSRGTMKVRANHVLWKDDNTTVFDASFENQLRYKAVGDLADMAPPGSSGVYGNEAITQPQDFPLAYEFKSEDDRDVFVGRLQKELMSAGDKQECASNDGSNKDVTKVCDGEAVKDNNEVESRT